PKKKAKKQDESGELVAAGAGTAVATPVAKPKTSRGWLWGVSVAVLFIVAAGVVWYLSPDLLKSAYESSPSYVAPKNIVAKVEPSTRARALMDNMQYAQAAALLKDAAKTPPNLSTRAEARWLK